MKRVLLLTSTFLVLLVVTSGLSGAAVSYLQSLYVSPNGRPSWLEWFASVEVLSALVHAVVFAIAGAVLAAVGGRLCRPLLLAILFGLVYSGMVFSLAPSGWLPVTYSHAPGWLWFLSWAPFYMPSLACLLGALAFARVRSPVPTSLHLA
jgi:hypothetical protein